MPAFLTEFPQNNSVNSEDLNDLNVAFELANENLNPSQNDKQTTILSGVHTIQNRVKSDLDKLKETDHFFETEIDQSNQLAIWKLQNEFEEEKTQLQEKNEEILDRLVKVQQTLEDFATKNGRIEIDSVENDKFNEKMEIVNKLKEEVKQEIRNIGYKIKEGEIKLVRSRNPFKREIKIHPCANDPRMKIYDEIVKFLNEGLAFVNEELEATGKELDDFKKYSKRQALQRDN